MKAYLNKPELKKRLLLEVKKHEKMDAIIQGSYGKLQNGKWVGCAVGCSLKSLNIISKTDEETSRHERYEPELGIPVILAHLEDRIFENLSVTDAKKWPRQFLSAISVGSDLSGVWDKFALWMLENKKDGMLKFAKEENTKQAIQDVINLFKKRISGKKVTSEHWAAATASATAATAYAAAYATASTYAAYAAYAAATAYAASAAAATATASTYASYAAYATYAAATASASYAAVSAAYAAYRNHYKKMAKKLLQLLKEDK